MTEAIPIVAGADDYVRLPGLYRRWEIERLLEPGTDFHIEEAGTASDQDYYLRRTDRASTTARAAHELSIDLRVFLVTLSPELRALCEQLASETIAELVRHTGTPRSTIYESIKKLRRLLSDAGLDGYLEAAPDTFPIPPVSKQ